MPQCKKCGNELHGKQESYCSQRCSKLHLKSLYKKRNRARLAAYNRQWRKANPEKVRMWRHATGADVYVVQCPVCPEGVFTSFRKRRYCPLHSPRTPKKMRFMVLERDGFRCRYCGRSAPDVVLQVDHVQPRKHGGTNELDKLVTACTDCNIGKGANRLSNPRSPGTGIAIS